MEKALRASLDEAIAFLEENGYRYALVGGIALSQWGVVRVTRDVDLKVLVPDADYESVRLAICEAFPSSAREHLPKNPLIVSVVVRDVIVDFLLALPGYEEKIIERAKKANLGGIIAWVCSAEDLIILKAVAGRGRDWPDIEALLIEQKGNLDEAYIKEWLEQFAEALDRPEILDEFFRLKKENSG